MDEISGIYEDFSKIVTNQELADLIEDNTDVLVNSGLNKDSIETAQSLLRTFDASTVIDVIQNDLDIDRLINLYKNGASLTEIMTSLVSETSPVTMAKIAFKILLSSFYFRIALFVFVLVSIYSIYITGLIFKKSGKHGFYTVIPILRDIIHLKVCNMSPWLLLLVFIPILGWLMLVSVAIIARFELSKSFGHGFLFGLGLLFFPIIFRSIIAFSDNEHIDDLYEDED